MHSSKGLIKTISILVAVTASWLPAKVESIEHVIGVGVGIPYGGVGFNYELGVTDFFAPTVSLGYAIERLEWNVGARLYYPGRESKIRGRVTAMYGFNGLFESTLDKNVFVTTQGFSAGLGMNWRFSETWAFDTDLTWVETEAPEPGFEDAYPVQLSLGFSYRF